MQFGLFKGPLKGGKKRTCRRKGGQNQNKNKNKNKHHGGQNKSHKNKHHGGQNKSHKKTSQFI